MTTLTQSTMFEYKKGQRMTAKFRAEQSKLIGDAASFILAKHGAKAEKIEAEVRKYSGGVLYASVTLLNGSGPTPFKPIKADFNAARITVTPMEYKDGVRTCMLFDDEASWIVTPPQES